MDFKSFSTKPSEANSLIALCIASAGFFHGFHFITKSYSKHKAFDHFYETMPELVDVYAEMYLGDDKTYTPPNELKFYTDAKVLLGDLESLINVVYKTSTPAEQSCLDDITTLCRQTRYMLTLE